MNSLRFLTIFILSLSFQISWVSSVYATDNCSELTNITKNTPLSFLSTNCNLFYDTCVKSYIDGEKYCQDISQRYVTELAIHTNCTSSSPSFSSCASFDRVASLADLRIKYQELVPNEILVSSTPPEAPPAVEVAANPTVVPINNGVTSSNYSGGSSGGTIGGGSSSGRQTLDYTPLAPLTDSQAGHAISLTSYLPFMFTLLIGVSALLAMVMIVVGGITYMTTDVFSTKSSGRGMMTSAVYGLLFVLSSYMILYTINPDLLSFKLSFVGLKGAEWGGGVTVPDTPTTPTTEAGCASWGGNWVVTPNTDAMSSVGGPSIGSCVGGTPPTVPNQDGTIISPSISSGVDKLNAQARSQDTYSGQCALYVRQALAAEGYIDLNGDHPTAAAGYGPYLTKDGFTSVAQNSQGGYLPRAGDVVVIQPPLVNDPSGGSGHIAMYNGSNWVSDTTQSQFLPARSASSPWQSASYQVYRPKN